MSTTTDANIAAPQSLYEYLTRISAPRPFPVTAAAITFIQAIAQNACQAKRNVQTLCRIARRACEICDMINMQMTQASEEKDWDAMENCGDVIEQLEELLSDALVISEDEPIADLENSAHWLRNRNILSDILLSLYGDPFEPVEYAWDEDRITSRRHDDIVWIERITEFMEQHSPKGDDLVAISRLIPEIKSALQRVPLYSNDNEHAPTAAMILSTKCILKASMIIKASATATDSSSDTPVKSTWGSTHLFFAKGIMEDLLNAIKNDAFTMEDIEERWTKLEASALFGLQRMPLARRKGKGREIMMFKLKPVFEAPKDFKETDASELSDGINFAEIHPGALVFQHVQDPGTTVIQDLRLGHTGSVILPNDSRVVALNEARNMIAYCIGDDENNYVRLSPLPFNAFRAVSEIEVEGEPVYMFWMQHDKIGFLNEHGVFYTSSITSDDGDATLGAAELLFSLPENSTINANHLDLSVIMDGDRLAWMALNILVNEVQQVQLWSQKALRRVEISGIGSLTAVTIDGEPHTLLVTTAPTKNDSLSFTIYDLDDRLPSRPFPIVNTEIPLGLRKGKPSFIHAFQPQGVAFIVVTEQHDAHAVLCDIHTGAKLQETAHHVTLFGTFSPESLGGGNAGVGLLVLQPGTNMVERITIIEEVLKTKRTDWLSI